MLKGFWIVFMVIFQRMAYTYIFVADFILLRVTLNAKDLSMR